jgi:hypothetical protein
MAAIDALAGHPCVLSHYREIPAVRTWNGAFLD